MSILPPTKRSQHYTDEWVRKHGTYSDDGILVFLACIDFLHEILGVLDGDLVRVAIQVVDHRYHILLAALDPPRLKTNACYVLYTHALTEAVGLVLHRINRELTHQKY